ncbi:MULTISPECIES: sugar kinase [unclassified Cryobacterium]|uniref:sugar kinase n=1 Tax=unclassified Cryobacterium TaxID=2649013 RepID=UPI00106C645D|nr:MULTISPECIES: sugar kinase [unclassified Cryobacterium]MDY7529748.1 sugar kinase [Cryobacterium sp. 10C2]MDY7558122.1 sugar kinase [Cryobacterium sp. 10C3]MEB0202813.1 sugar kinase [Cryobacterium sp. 5I3]MEB0289490.1 sugar kinase [Cryobacterium sp. 10C2]TFC04411.1 sugar kinase [Cryobacterium sp. MDB2-33-2]
METPEVLCLGETMVLVTPTEATPLADSALFHLAVGGAESTVAMYLAESGFRTSWISSVGDDPLGRRILESLHEQRVDTSLVTLNPNAPTGVYFKNPGGIPGVYYYRKGSAASMMTVEILDALPLATARLIHTSGVTPGLSSSCRELMLALPSRLVGTTTLLSFDVNYRAGVWSVEEAAPVLLRLARQADIVFVGLDEAEVLWQTHTPQAVFDLIRPLGTLIVKNGAVGATEFSSGTEVFVAAPHITVVEEVGAGDAFAAGYLAAQLNGDSAEESLSAGHGCAARTLQSTSDFVPRERV